MEASALLSLRPSANTLDELHAALRRTHAIEIELQEQASQAQAELALARHRSRQIASNDHGRWQERMQADDIMRQGPADLLSASILAGDVAAIRSALHQRVAALVLGECPTPPVPLPNTIHIDPPECGLNTPEKGAA